MALPLEARAHVVPRYGKVFIRRLDPRVGSAVGIIIPDAVRESYRPSNAEIMAVGEGVEGWERKDRVLLAAGVGKRMVFGERAEETWESVGPEMFMAKILDADVGKPHEKTLRYIRPEQTVIDPETAFVADEGLRKAPA